MADASEHPVRLWAMPVDALREQDVEPWKVVLDAAERSRAERLAIERNRVEYVAAHALTRALLSAVTGEAPSVFRYEAGARGKPSAFVGGRPLGIHFNLSHTAGLVAVAASPRLEIGVDVEAVDRGVDLRVADRYFFGAEGDWLAGLAPERRTEGFLRLWTLKEAYIKATGRGMSQPLHEFWFDVDPPAVRFTDAIADDETSWQFHQWLIGERFLAAVGWRRDGGTDPRLVVEIKDPADLAF